MKLDICKCTGRDDCKVYTALQDVSAKLGHRSLSRALDDQIRAWRFAQRFNVRHDLNAVGKL